MRMPVGPQLDRIIAAKQEAEARSLQKLEANTEAGYQELMASSLSAEGTRVASTDSGARENTTSTAQTAGAADVGSYMDAPLQKQQTPSNHPVSGTKLDWSHGPGAGDAGGSVKRGGNMVHGGENTPQVGPNEGAAQGRK